jgi:hypothetical protein
VLPDRLPQKGNLANPKPRELTGALKRRPIVTPNVDLVRPYLATRPATVTEVKSKAQIFFGKIGGKPTEDTQPAQHNAFSKAHCGKTWDKYSLLPF